MTAANKYVPEGPADRILEIVRVFDAPPSLVYTVWITPEHAKRWSAPDGLELFHCDMDVRPGGTSRCGMRAGDGAEYWATEVYQEVVENELLVFTQAWDDANGKPGPVTTIVVQFEDVDGKTRVTMRQGVFATVEGRNNHNEGWLECFEQLATYVRQLAEAA
jgi:uncharacterized protein YndB with AHSA1/START domain